jgi:hypothetical protein
MSRPYPVAKRGIRFFIDADAKCVAKSRPIDWYLQWWIKRYNQWEGRTFIILDTFLDARRPFIDVGEKIVLPELEPFLRRYRPTLYLSLHWMQLTKSEIESMYDLVSSIYDCIYDDSLLRSLDKQRLLSQKMSSIVCTSTPILPLQRLRIRRMILTRWFRAALESVRVSLNASLDSKPAPQIEHV